MRVLIIEDNDATAQQIELMLRARGFVTQVCDGGEEGIQLAKLYDFDAITVDLMLGDYPGVSAIRRIRAAGVRTPVVVVSHATRETAVDALNAGADDVLPKPFHIDELEARLHSVIRRARGHSEELISYGNTAIDIKSKRMLVNGRPVHLTGKQYLMLELLILRQGSTITPDAFMNHLYGGRDEPEANIVKVFLCKIRKILRAVGSDIVIETVWGQGNVLRPLVVVDEPTAVDIAEQAA